MELLIILFIFYLIVSFHKKKNIYENFVPDERQYNICLESDLGNGETHISVNSNQIPKSNSGFFTSLLGITEENLHGKHFNIHSCSSSNINNVKQYDYIFNQNIIDHSNNETINDVYYNHKYHNPHPLSEFFVTYEYLDGKYDDKINLDFENTHQTIIDSDTRFGAP
tara:strand:+ start:311 stop:811 length:501 start_codon:yes stop_codon:yes gene_type:complete